jgi:hypothetical protein
MQISRRSWFGAAAAGLLGSRIGRLSAQPMAEVALEDRIRRIIAEYGEQGLHRTATEVDNRSGEWLIDQARATGAAVSRESFSLDRVDPGACGIVLGDRRIEGLPLFDGAFTDAGGIRGRIGPIGGPAEIGLVDAAPNTAGAGSLGDARRRHQHAAIVCVTRGGRPGLCPNNADDFMHAFGPPVLQVSSEEFPLLHDHAQRGTVVQVVTAVKRTPSAAFNVIATVPGVGGAMPPLVVMTPRSGWYGCASERGGGIACWLELLRAVGQAPLRRDVVFVASSGHEIGHLGIDAFVAGRPDIVRRAAGWMHFGANIGAAIRPDTAAGTTIQASDDERERILSDAVTAAGLAVGRRVPRGTAPGGEAEVVHRGGGRYVSVIGANALFHNPQDRGVETVDLPAIARFTLAFATVARALAGQR